MPGAPDAVTRTVMSRIEAAMLLGVYALVDQFEHGFGVEFVMTVASLIGPLGFLAVGQALQNVGIRVVALAIAAGFTAAAAAFSAAVRRGAREEKEDAVPAGELATVLTAEARPD